MQFLVPNTVEEALAMLSERGDGLRVLAGGTDVMIQRMTGQLPRSESLLYIGGIAELQGVDCSNGIIRIGALTTHRHLRCDPIITTNLPSFAEAAATVGGWQTQVVGTVGGNLCNASPAADLAPPILAADATMVVSGVDGPTRIPADRFFVDRRRTALPPGQILLGIEVPAPPGGHLGVLSQGGAPKRYGGCLGGLGGPFQCCRQPDRDSPIRCLFGGGNTAEDASCRISVGGFYSRRGRGGGGGATVDGGGSIRSTTSGPTATYRRMLVGRLIRKAARVARKRLGIE